MCVCVFVLCWVVFVFPVGLFLSPFAALVCFHLRLLLLLPIFVVPLRPLRPPLSSSPLSPRPPYPSPGSSRCIHPVSARGGHRSRSP